MRARVKDKQVRGGALLQKKVIYCQHLLSISVGRWSCLELVLQVAPEAVQLQINQLKGLYTSKSKLDY